VAQKIINHPKKNLTSG